MPYALARALTLADILTDDEYEVLRCLVAGESMRTIAVRLSVDEKSAFALKKSLIAKLGGRCTADAVREGILEGL